MASRKQNSHSISGLQLWIILNGPASILRVEGHGDRQVGPIERSQFKSREPFDADNLKE